MKTIKNKLVFVPLFIMVLLIIIGISVLVAGQPDEIKIQTNSEFTRFLEKEAGDSKKRAALYNDIKVTDSFNPTELACEFDANGHTIEINNNGVYCLFDCISETGTVKNLVLAGKLGGTDNQVTAGICIRNLGTVENCMVCADFSGGGFVDGICHTNNGGITNCFVHSYESGDREFRYVWNPICAENGGSVKDCFYSDASTGEYDTEGTYISTEETKVKNTVKILNEYSKNNSGLIGWETGENGYPCLKTNGSREVASVFSGGIGVFLVCIVILIIAVPILTIVYTDKQKKKVFYKKFKE